MSRSVTVQSRCFRCGSVHCVQIWRSDIDTTRKAIDCATTLPLGVFGRPFVKRFALCYRSVVCLSCPVCLSLCPVCDVRALWPNGWTDQDESWHAVGLGPGHTVLGGDRAPPPLKGHSPPNFQPISVAAKCQLVLS